MVYIGFFSSGFGVLEVESFLEDFFGLVFWVVFLDEERSWDGVEKGLKIMMI